MTSHVFAQASDVGTVDGPLQGNHREWYVVRPGSELAHGGGRLKVGEPREDVLWYDRRQFAHEEELLRRLAEHRVPRVPPVHSLGSHGPMVFGFIEGQPLNERAAAGTDVPHELVGQIMEVFGALAHLPAERVSDWGLATLGGEVPENCGQFMRSLIAFTRDEVYAKRLAKFGALFEQLGVSDRPLGDGGPLAEEADRLAARPLCLVHGDLHRANFIVDAAGRLWTIDWELAAVGDPLYDLATHLHLMRYPEEQERKVKERWRATVRGVLPGDGNGNGNGNGFGEAFDEDLSRYLAYKRLQSVYTDVIRHAIKVSGCTTPEEREAQLHHSAKVVEYVLGRAREHLGLDDVPDAWSIARAYDDFCRAD
ncbi:phosphotransferase [Streptomyces sp. HNM0575]|uniref:aminoglycoside phosphotransferase family protein n=1 Tax=Streptomyces sp. HNM0575 TaxID=2716338 RepID=UPI00145D8725|nr:aminoglycoside phosphotransferase family protein [Streptomyces sp. HNM0575]NLU74088.1 phosphotransferase [Streptomyces sp. HNM0575]